MSMRDFINVLQRTLIEMFTMPWSRTLLMPIENIPPSLHANYSRNKAQGFPCAAVAWLNMSFVHFDNESF